jgi:hypothetical protein
MAEKQTFDSDLIGYVDEPKYYDGKLGIMAHLFERRTNR